MYIRIHIYGWCCLKHNLNYNPNWKSVSWIGHHTARASASGLRLRAWAWQMHFALWILIALTTRTTLTPLRHLTFFFPKQNDCDSKSHLAKASVQGLRLPLVALLTHNAFWCRAHRLISHFCHLGAGFADRTHAPLSATPVSAYAANPFQGNFVFK